jgi:2-methylcitrate dehydratase PrpD
MSGGEAEGTRITAELCRYIAGALGRNLPAEVAAEARHHLIDTLAAMVSGSRLGPGKIAIEYVRALGGTSEALIAGTDFTTTAVNAALANGMAAHADETDDSHVGARTHIGCSIVPASLAMAEREGRDGEALLRAITLGYDVAARINFAIGPDYLLRGPHNPHSLGPGFGAAAAAGALAGIDADQAIHLLAYAGNQSSGLRIYMRDESHIGKAFDFGGMPARNGVTSATMAAAGFTGVADALTGQFGFFDAFSPDPDLAALVDGLGSRFEITRTNIKKWSVGSPAQAALDSLEALMAEHAFSATDVQAIEAHMPDDRAHIVDDRKMPDINLQHLLAVLLTDGGLSFETSHDYARMKDPAILDLKRRITMVPSNELTRARPERQAIIEITLNDGQRLTHRTRAVRGTPENPMESAEVEAKALDLMAPVLGKDRADRLIEAVRGIEKLDDARDLRRWLAA